MLQMISSIPARDVKASQALYRTPLESVEADIKLENLKVASGLHEPSRTSKLASYIKSYQSFLCRCFKPPEGRKAQRYMDQLVGVVAKETNASERPLPVPQDASSEDLNRFLFHGDISQDLSKYAKEKSQRFIEPLSEALEQANEQKTEILAKQKKILSQAIDDAILQYQHNAFLNNVVWNRMLKQQIQAHLFNELSENDAYGKAHPDELRRLLVSALRTNKPHYHLGNEGGRFESFKSTTPRLPGTQIRTAGGDIYEQITSPNEAQWQLMHEQHALNPVLHRKKGFKKEGGFGTVRMAKNLSSDSEYFDKVVAQKKYPSVAEAKKEISAYQFLEPRSHTLKFIDYAMAMAELKRGWWQGQLVDKPSIFLEFANKGNGLNQATRIDKLRKKDPKEAEELLRRTVFHCFVGIAQVHEQGGSHRDIKPENFLYGDFDGEFDPQEGFGKIADFGLFSSDKSERPDSITPHFTPPEVFYEDYCGQSHDIFAMALVAIMLKYNEYADKVSEPQLYIENESIQLEFMDNRPICLGVPGRDLPGKTFDEVVYNCLNFNMDNRPGVETVLKYPYFEGLEFR